MGQKQMGVCYRQVEMSVCSLLCWVDIHAMSIQTVNSKRDLMVKLVSLLELVGAMTEVHISTRCSCHLRAYRQDAVFHAAQ